MLRKNRAAFSKLMSLMDIKPHAYQQKVIDAFLSGERFIVVVAGRRGGKTRLAAALALYGTMESNCTIWIVSKTYDLTKRVWDYLVKDIETLYRGRGYTIVESTLTIKLPWGTIVECKSADHPASLVGKGVDLLIVDEAAEVPEKVWLNRLAPTLRDKKGTAVFITTPAERRGWIFDVFTDGQLHKKGYWSIMFPSWENTYVYDAEEIALAKEQHDELSFRRQYGAEFVSFSNVVYSGFDRYECLKENPNVENWSISLAVDPGYNGRCAILWIAHNKTAGEDIVIKEVIQPKLEFKDVLEIIKDNEPPHGYEAFICDRAGNAESQQTGESFVSWMEEQPYFQNKKYYWNFSHVPLIPSINLVRARLRDANGNRHLFFSADCVEMTYCMENYAYPEDSDKEVPLKDNRTDHGPDALRYYVWWRYNRPTLVSAKRL